MQNLTKIIENFSNVKILVVGDVMLDRYLWGNVSRISPEAPVPIVNIVKTSMNLGGAANVAANIAGLGAEALLVGVTGEDREAEALAQVLSETGISPQYLVRLKNRRTTIKTRIVAHSQHVVRYDQETVNAISQAEENSICEKIESIFPQVSLLVISDYAKGIFTDSFTKRLIRSALSQNKTVLVDPKGKDFNKYKGAAILTPNRKEALEACNVNDAPDAVDRAAKQLIESLNLKAVLVTQGENGMTLLNDKNEFYHLKALARKVYDVTGAGDTVIAVMATSISAGADLRQAAEIANFAAGLVVEKVGTTTLTKEMLANQLEIR